MTMQAERPVSRWARTSVLIALVPALVLAYLVAMNTVDTATPRAPTSLQVIWWLCVIGAVLAAVAAGVIGGILRALVLTGLLWGVLAAGTYALLGPTCPLASIATVDGPAEPQKVGVPPVRLQETFDALCSVSGTVAGSVDAR